MRPKRSHFDRICACTQPLVGMEDRSKAQWRRNRKRRRGGGRAGNTQRRGTRAIDQMPWRLPINLDKPTEPLSEEGINAIHEGAMCILEDIGIAILNDEARDIFSQRMQR